MSSVEWCNDGVVVLMDGQRRFVLTVGIVDPVGINHIARAIDAFVDPFFGRFEPFVRTIDELTQHPFGGVGIVREYLLYRIGGFWRAHDVRAPHRIECIDGFSGAVQFGELIDIGFEGRFDCLAGLGVEIATFVFETVSKIDVPPGRNCVGRRCWRRCAIAAVVPFGRLLVGIVSARDPTVEILGIVVRRRRIDNPFDPIEERFEISPEGYTPAEFCPLAGGRRVIVIALGIPASVIGDRERFTTAYIAECLIHATGASVVVANIVIGRLLGLFCWRWGIFLLVGEVIRTQRRGVVGVLPLFGTP